MSPADRVHLPTFVATALAITCAAGLSIAVGVSACLTAPPPPVPEIPQQRPQILQASVFPPADQDLTALPPDGQFIVPLLISQPDQSFEFEVYVDFNPGVDNNLGDETGERSYGNEIPATLDGGIFSVSFTLQPNQLGDPNACHLIQFLVAHSFDLTASSTLTASPHTPDTLGSDIVTWHYVPNPLNGCLEYDAGLASRTARFQPTHQPTAC